MFHGNEHIVPIDIAATTDNTIDIFDLTAGTTIGVGLVQVVVTTDIEQDANEVNLKCRLVRYRGTFTAGTGGTTTPAKPMDGSLGTDSDSATVNIGNTTPAAVGTGTEEILGEPYLNNRVGLELNFESRPITALATDAIVFGINEGAAIPSTAFGGWLRFVELV